MLDDEVDAQPPEEEALLPTVLSFLSSFPDYLDIVVQCARKTEVRSWETLFRTLPPPRELFEESLQRGMLKTAGGYLIVLQTFEQAADAGCSDQCVRLLHKARQAGDWDLCKELARFLMALDQSGDTLREAMRRLEASPPPTPLLPDKRATSAAAAAATATNTVSPSAKVSSPDQLSPQTARRLPLESPSSSEAGPSYSQPGSLSHSPARSTSDDDDGEGERTSYFE